MKAPTLHQSEQVVRDRMEALERVLPELTLAELRHLHEVLQQKSGDVTRQQVEMVVRAIDDRKYLCMQPAVAVT
jgi:hypothetical protein